MAQVVAQRQFPGTRWLIFAALSLVDLSLTAYALLVIGGSEANPLFAWIGHPAGLVAALAVAKAAVLFFVWYKPRPLTFACIVTGGVVLWNIAQVTGLW